MFPRKPLTPLEKGYVTPEPSIQKVDGSAVTQPVSGEVTVTGVNQTSGLALESTQQQVSTRVGSQTETAPATDTASSGLNGRLQRVAQRLTTLITNLGSPFQAGGSIGNTAFGVNNGAGVNAVNIQDGGNSITVDAITLPLPTGAATALNQTDGSQKTQIIDSNGDSLGTPTNPISVDANLNVDSEGLSTFQEQYTQTELLTLIYEELQAQTKLLKKIYQ